MSRKDPYMQFFPDDWLSSVDLRACSFAAQGLWMSLLAIMHRHTPERGRLALPDGSPMTPADIVDRLGKTVEEVTSLLAELKQKGVLSFDETSAVINRRMWKEHKVSGERSKAGSKGGKKTQSKTQAKLKQIPGNGSGSGNGNGDGSGSSLNSEERGRSNALAVVALALADWEREGLPVITDYVDADRAVGFAEAVHIVAERHGCTAGTVIRRATIAAGASAWCRGETSTNSRPVDSGWLVAPTKRTSHGSRPLPLGEHVERIERLLAGYYEGDRAAELQKPKHPVIIARDMALEAAARAEQANMWPDEDPGGPESGALRLAVGDSERRSRWVPGGEA